MSAPTPKMLSPAQVAQRCATSRRSVMRAIERHELRATRDNRNHWKVNAGNADRWAAAQWATSEQRSPVTTLRSRPILLSCAPKTRSYGSG